MTTTSWPSRTRHYRCPEGSVYILIADDENGKPYYVDIRVSKAGGSAMAAAANALGILVGSSLRRGTAVAKLRTYLRGISVVSQAAVDAGEYDALSMADALGRCLEEEYL
jgi:hypothetical protein